MKVRKAYRTIEVNDVAVEKLAAGRAGMAYTVGEDCSKGTLVLVVRWQDGTFSRPWRAENPDQIGVVVKLLQDLAQGRRPVVGMESTGTYGDAFRQALTDAGLDVQRVSGKAVHDYAEIFDGVPSQHDGKDAAIVAELVSQGKSVPWPYVPADPWDQELADWVNKLDLQEQLQQVFGDA